MSRKIDHVLAPARFSCALPLLGLVFVLAGCPMTGEEPSVDGGVPPVDAVVDHDGSPGFEDAGEDAGADAGADAGEDAGADAGADAGEDAGADASAPIEVPVHEYLAEAEVEGVVYRQMRYRSGGLWIRGVAAFPNDDRVHPAIIHNHGGVAGVGPSDLTVIHSRARTGIIVFASEYRGEGGSEGEIEMCNGEVDDVVALTHIAAAHPRVDATRISMLGGSHGGCVTLRAIQKGAPVQSAVALFPAPDIARLHRFYDESQALAEENGLPAIAADYRARRDGFAAVCGGTPEEVPEAYAARSATAHLDALAARTDVDLLVVHGMRDALIHYSDSCDFAARAASFESYRVGSSTELVGVSPPGCEALSFRVDGFPFPAWSAHHTFLLIDELTHGENLESTGGLAAAFDFIAAHLR